MTMDSSLAGLGQKNSILLDPSVSLCVDLGEAKTIKISILKPSSISIASQLQVNFDERLSNSVHDFEEYL